MANARKGVARGDLLVMDRPKLSGMLRLLLAFANSWKGFKGAFAAEEAFRQEVMLAIVLLPLGVWLGKTGIEKALLVGSVLLVLIVELLNTGIETVVDRIGLERHELSGLAKDVGSTAVLLSFAVLIVVWGFVLAG
jgi:diacylglycerol kinase (ATP)